MPKVESIWRRMFDPERVEIPWEEYKDFMPCVRVIPIGLDDPLVCAVDEDHRSQLATLYMVIRERIYEAEPRGVGFLSVSQLLLQLPSILKGKAAELLIRRGPMVVKRVPVDEGLKQICRTIAKAYSERILLFEDHLLAESPLAGAEFGEYSQQGKVASLALFEKSKKAECLGTLV